MATTVVLMVRPQGNAAVVSFAQVTVEDSQSAVAEQDLLATAKRLGEDVACYVVSVTGAIANT